MVMLDSVRRKTLVPALARWLLGVGIAATLPANVATGLGHGWIGAAVAARRVVALVGLIRTSHDGFPKFSDFGGRPLWRVLR
jgi:hypothetical protein